MAMHMLRENGKLVIVADSRHTHRWSERELAPTLCRGDLAFHCNVKEVADQLASWAHSRDNGNPRNMDDLTECEFVDVLRFIAEEHHLDKSVGEAFVGTEEAMHEPDEKNLLDAVAGREDEAFELDAKAMADEEAEVLDAMPLPGHPAGERERRRKWSQLPRRARIAIRRLHRNLRHLPKNALVAMLKAAKAPHDFIEAARTYRCDTCVQNEPKKPTHKVAPPKRSRCGHRRAGDSRHPRSLI